jgi:hypothetical protein
LEELDEEKCGKEVNSSAGEFQEDEWAQMLRSTLVSFAWGRLYWEETMWFEDVCPGLQDVQNWFLQVLTPARKKPERGKEREWNHELMTDYNGQCCTAWNLLQGWRPHWFYIIVYENTDSSCVEHAAATNVIVEVACEQVYSSNGSNLPQTRPLDFTYNTV